MGIIACTSNEVFYSRKKFATDLYFYVSDRGRGSGPALAKAFLRWAQALPGVREISMSITSEMEGSERTALLYEHLGFQKTGEIFSYRGEKEDG